VHSGKVEEAGPALRAAIVQEPTDSKALFFMGIVCQVAQNWEEAFFFFSRAVFVNCVQSKENQDYEESLRTAMSGIKEIKATAKLRFALGTRVKCNGHDTCGEVVDFFYRESNWVPERPSAPYQVELDDGRLIYCQFDFDQCVEVAHINM